MNGRQGRTQRGLQLPPNPQKPEFKKQIFVDIIIAEVLRDLPSSWNQPLKSADD
jgi:hypothetical protein